METRLALASNFEDEKDNIEPIWNIFKDYCFKWVVIDSGSTDGTIEELKRVVGDKLKLVQSDMVKYNGYGFTRNKLVELADGADWVLLWDADERMLPEDLEKLPLLLEFKNHCDIIWLPRCHYQDLEMTKVEYGNDQTLGTDWKHAICINPDWQPRLIKRDRQTGKTKVQFYRRVHERVNDWELTMDNNLRSPVIRHFGWLKAEFKKVRNEKLFNKLYHMDLDNKEFVDIYKEDGYVESVNFQNSEYRRIEKESKKEKKSIGIVVPFFNTPMWIQTSIYCLKKYLEPYKSDYNVRVLVVNNAEESGPHSFKKEAIRAITDVEEFKGFAEVIANPEKSKFHKTALDTAIRYLDTDYMLCWEPDIAIFKENWLKFIMDYFNDGSFVWVAGYEWKNYYGSRNDMNWYIMPNPGMYRMDILKEIDAECLSNTSPDHYYGLNYGLVKSDEMMDYRYGPFSERRGFSSLDEHCPDGKGMFIRNNPGHYEPGQWLFYRMMRDKKDVQFRALASIDRWKNYNGHNDKECSDFGPGLFKHFWAGTRCYDFLKHTEANLCQIYYVKEKLELEMKLWKEIVPENIRKIVPEIYNSCRNDSFEYGNLRYIADVGLGDAHHQKLAADVADWYKALCFDTDYQGLMK